MNVDADGDEALEAFLSDLRDDGRAQGLGQFTVCLKKLAAKISSFRYENPGDYLLKLVQAAVLLDCKEVRFQFHQQRQSVDVALVAPQQELDLEQMIAMFRSPLSSSLSLWQRNLISALTGADSEAVRVVSWHGGWRLSVDAEGKMEVLRLRKNPKRPSLEIHFIQKSDVLSLGERSALFSPLRQRVTMCPIPVFFNGKRLNTVESFLGDYRDLFRRDCEPLFPGYDKQKSKSFSDKFVVTSSLGADTFFGWKVCTLLLDTLFICLIGIVSGVKAIRALNVQSVVRAVRALRAPKVSADNQLSAFDVELDPHDPIVVSSLEFLLVHQTCRGFEGNGLFPLKQESSSAFYSKTVDCEGGQEQESTGLSESRTQGHLIVPANSTKKNVLSLVQNGVTVHWLELELPDMGIRAALSVGDFPTDLSGLKLVSANDEFVELREQVEDQVKSVLREARVELQERGAQFLNERSQSLRFARSERGFLLGMTISLAIFMFSGFNGMFSYHPVGGFCLLVLPPLCLTVLSFGLKNAVDLVRRRLRSHSMPFDESKVLLARLLLRFNLGHDRVSAISLSESHGPEVTPTDRL